MIKYFGIVKIDIVALTQNIYPHNQSIYLFIIVLYTKDLRNKQQAGLLNVQIKPVVFDIFPVDYIYFQNE